VGPDEERPQRHGTRQVKAIDGVGLELRFLIDGELRHSQLFRDWPSLEQAAAEKKTDFLSRGWQ